MNNHIYVPTNNRHNVAMLTGAFPMWIIIIKNI